MSILPKREVRFRDEAGVRSFIIQSLLSVLRTKGSDGLPVETISAIQSIVTPSPISLSTPINPTASPSVEPKSVPHSPAPLKLGWKLLARLREERAVFETPTGLAILDIGAAHQRILYENILKQFSEKTSVSQPLLIPLNLEFEPLPASVLKRKTIYR
jgi:DNA mismatch repair protein MutL